MGLCQVCANGTNTDEQGPSKGQARAKQGTGYPQSRRVRKTTVAEMFLRMSFLERQSTDERQSGLSRQIMKEQGSPNMESHVRVKRPCICQGAALRGISDPRQAGVWGSGPRVKILDAGTELGGGGASPRTT